jgi:hypothetical protein
VAYPVEANFETDGATMMATPVETGGYDVRYRHKLGGGGFLGLGVAGKAWLECSLPKRIGDHNVTALDVPLALETLRDAYDEAGRYCTPRDHTPFEGAKLVRLDGVRDFNGVRHVPQLLDGLAMIQRDDKRWKVRRYQDAERAMAETVRVGPRAWGGTLYDKHAESPEHAAAGRVRFEARLHNEQLTSVFARKNGGHIGVIADISQHKLDRLTHAMFRRCAFDREVSAMATVAESVRNYDGVSERERAALWAYLTMPGFGATIAPNTERKYRRIAKDLGMCVVGDLEVVAELYTMRLDYGAATEVITRAA